MRWLTLIALITACGGTVIADAGTDAGTDAHPVDDSGCPQPPSTATYACDAEAPDAAGCGPWDGDGGERYPIGCVVTTTAKSTFCGPVTCNCMTGTPFDGATWTCPL